MVMRPEILAQTIVGGLPSSKDSLSAMLESRSFSMRPLPNAYFMRDTAAIFRNHLLSGATAHDVRLIESIATRFIFTHHEDFRAHGLILDGPEERNRFITIEGGDFLVLSSTMLAIGVSERTSADAVQRVALNAAKNSGKRIRVFAVQLPRERATIHLDMVFTVIDRDASLVYEPLVMGHRKCRVFRMDAEPDGRSSIHEEAGLLEALSSHGMDLKPVLCGDGDLLYQEREQWWSGANSFAFEPGKIIMYACNRKTLDALEKSGFAVKRAEDFISREDSTGNYRRLAVAFDGIELARGGGGARCMTCPVEREDV
jgi:arginine deiminase